MTMRAGSGNRHANITPSDSATIVARGIYVGTAGDVVIKDDAGTSATYKAPQGIVIPLYGGAVTVMSTGTTATDLVRIYDSQA